MTNPGGILVAAPERWDEACFAVPALRAMVASGLTAGVLCPAEQREFWNTIEGLTVIDFPLKAKVKQVAAEIAGKWEASLAWETGLAADAFKGAGITRRLGAGVGKLAKSLTHPLTFSAGPLEHRVRHYLLAVEQLGIETARPEFFAPVPGPQGETSAILLAPGSDFGTNHEWPLDRWEVIARKLQDAHRQVTIASIGTGRDVAKVLADRLGNGVGLLRIPSLGESLPSLAAHPWLLAADGSLPHLAAHVGATCITLFGPNDPTWKRPLGRRHAVVRRHVECAPCLLPKCPLDLRCQNELEINRVWAAISGVIG